MRLRKKTKLDAADRRSLLTLHYECEKANLEAAIRKLEFDAEAERITKEYGIDHEKQNIDLSTGEIVTKEQRDA